MTREHVFARWLIQKVHGAKLVASDGSSADTPTRIGRVTANVCAVCNAGWMSGLEVAFRRIVFARPRTGLIPSPDRATLSRWFTKTAVLLADARGSDLVRVGARSALVSGMPDGIEVSLARLRRPRQPVDFTIEATGGDPRRVGIVVHDLVAHVAPRGTLAGRHGTRLWPLRTHALRWETLPLVTWLAARDR